MTGYKERIIAHRGNLYGSDPLTENSPEAILHALNEGFSVEFDFRIIGGLFINEDKPLNIGLGHDAVQYQLTSELGIAIQEKRSSKIFLHAKNGITFITNLEILNDTFPLNVDIFYNDADAVALTANGYKWIHPDFDDKFEIQAWMLTDDKTVFVLDESQYEVAKYLLQNTESLVCCDYGAKLLTELQNELI